MSRDDGVLRRKSVEDSIAASDEPQHDLKRQLNAWDLAVMGVSVAVGAGIFSIGASSAANYAGPSVILSFIIAALVCGLAIMCYAEFASALPVAGSAYTFSYATMGEIVAWIIGWDLILEMVLTGSIIAKVWGIYLDQAVGLFTGHTGVTSIELIAPNADGSGGLSFGWASFLITVIMTALLVAGTKLSTNVASVFTVLKVGIAVFVIVVGFGYFKSSNLHPFFPPSQPAPGKTGVEQSLWGFLSGADPTMYGVAGMLGAAALVFFAFLGFDVVATSAEEAKNPRRTVPLGIMSGLGLVTVLYILVTLVTTGMVPYDELAKQDSITLATAFGMVGAGWAGKIISVGIVIGLTTVLLVVMFGSSRVIFSMSRDGLLPRWLSVTSDRFKTPMRIQLIIGAFIALMSSLTQIQLLEEMVNIGTLSAFIMVSFGVPVLRRTRPDLKRSFKVPGNPVLPIISGVACIWLALNLTALTWLRFLIWLAAGLVIYFGYSYRHSLLGKRQKAEATA